MSQFPNISSNAPFDPYGLWSKVVRGSAAPPAPEIAPTVRLSANENKDLSDPYSRWYYATRIDREDEVKVPGKGLLETVAQGVENFVRNAWLSKPIQKFMGGEAVKVGLGKTFQIFPPASTNYEEYLTEINEQTALYDETEAGRAESLVQPEEDLQAMKTKTDSDLVKFKTKISYFSILNALLYCSGTVESDRVPILSLVSMAEEETRMTGENPSLWKIFVASYGDKMSSFGRLKALLFYFFFCNRIPVITNIVDAYLDNVLTEMRSNLKENAGRRSAFIDTFINGADEVFDVYTNAIKTWANERKGGLNGYRQRAVNGLFWKGENKEKEAKAKKAFYKDLSIRIVNRFAPDVDFDLEKFYLGPIEGWINSLIRSLLRNQILPSALENISSLSQKKMANHNIPFFRALAENLDAQVKKIDESLAGNSATISQPLEVIRSYESIAAKILETIDMAPYAISSEKARQRLAEREENPDLIIEPLSQQGLQTGIALAVENLSNQESVEKIFDVLFDALTNAMGSLPGNTEMNSARWKSEKTSKKSAYNKLQKDLLALSGKIVDQFIHDFLRGGPPEEAAEKYAQNIFSEHKTRAESMVRQFLDALATMQQKIDPDPLDLSPERIELKELQKEHTHYTNLKAECEGLKASFEEVEKSESLPQIERNRIEAHMAKIKELDKEMDLQVLERRLAKIGTANEKMVSIDPFIKILEAILAKDGPLDKLAIAIERNHGPDDVREAILKINEQIRDAGFSRDELDQIQTLFLKFDTYSSVSLISREEEEATLESLYRILAARQNLLKEERDGAKSYLLEKSQGAIEKCNEGISKVSLKRVYVWKQMLELEIGLHDKNSIHPELTAYKSALSEWEKTERVETDMEQKFAPLHKADKNKILESLEPIYDGSRVVMADVLALQGLQTESTRYFNLKIEIEGIKAAFETIEAYKLPPALPENTLRVLDQEIKQIKAHLAAIKKIDPKWDIRALADKIEEIKGVVDALAKTQRSLNTLESIESPPEGEEGEEPGLIDQLIWAMKHNYAPFQKWSCVNRIREHIGNVGFLEADAKEVSELVGKILENYNKMPEERFRQEIWNPLHHLLDTRKTRLERERAKARGRLEQECNDPYNRCLGELTGIGQLQDRVLQRMKAEREALQDCTDALKNSVSRAKKEPVPTFSNNDLSLIGGVSTGAAVAAGSLLTGGSAALAALLTAVGTYGVSQVAGEIVIPLTVDTVVDLASRKVTEITNVALEEFMNPAFVSGIVNQLFLAIAETFPPTR